MFRLLCIIIKFCTSNCLCGFVLLKIIYLQQDRLVGQVVKASALGAEDLEFDSCLRCGDISRLSHTSDFKIGSLVATLPGAWRFHVHFFVCLVYIQALPLKLVGLVVKVTP